MSVEEISRRLLRRNRDFARLWTGEAVSAVGTQITLLALPLLAVQELDAGPGEMGALGFAQTIPFVPFALAAGVWVDHHRRRPLLIAANLARAGLLALIPLLALLGLLELWQLLAIAFGVGACTVLFEVGFQSYLPRLVGRDDLIEANSRLTAANSVAEVSGPGLAGILVGAIGASFTIAIDALSFLYSAVSLARIRRREAAPAPRPPDSGVRREIAEGFAETLHNRYLLAFAGEAGTYNVAWHAIDAILVLWAVRELGLGAGALGLLLSVGSVGALLGALLTERLARRIGVGRAMWGSALVSNLGVLLIPLAAGQMAIVIAVLGAAFFLQGLGSTGTNVHTYAIRQAVTPDRLLGRTNAVYRMLTWGLIPLGSLLGGLLGETLGLQTALWIGAALLFPSWLWLFFSPARSLRTLPDAAV
jgi:MFS family permease